MYSSCCFAFDLLWTLCVIKSNTVFSRLLALSAGKCVRLSSFFFSWFLTPCRCAVVTFPPPLLRKKNFCAKSSRWQITFVEQRGVKFPLLSQKLWEIWQITTHFSLWAYWSPMAASLSLLCFSPFLLPVQSIVEQKYSVLISCLVLFLSLLKKKKRQICLSWCPAEFAFVQTTTSFTVLFTTKTSKKANFSTAWTRIMSCYGFNITAQTTIDESVFVQHDYFVV